MSLRHAPQRAEPLARTHEESLGSEAHSPMGVKEFILILGAIMAVNALATDIMLPAFPQMGEALGTTTTEVQALITAYLLGFASGQIFIGFLADRFGRRLVLMIGLSLYCVAAYSTALAEDIYVILAIRFFHGMAAGAPRVIAAACVRDCYTGREMAKILSLVMTIFMATPLVAPAIGQGLMSVSGWRLIFVSLGLFSTVILAHCLWRFPETLPVERRVPIRIDRIVETFRVIFSCRQTIGNSLVAGVFFGGLFGFIAQSQQLIVGTYETGAWFPAIFALMVASIMLATVCNAMLVQKHGMRVISHSAILMFTLLSGAMVAFEALGRLNLYAYCLFEAPKSFCVGLVFTNLNALALEPHAKIAGVASSFISALSVMIGAGLGYWIGKGYDGTAMPLALGYLGCGLGSIALVLWTERGKFGVAGR